MELRYDWHEKVLENYYEDGCFYPENQEKAKSIILTGENGTPVQERWEKETPYLLELISQNFNLNSDSLVLDYGCGIGRISKEIIAKFGCRVLGVDNRRMIALSDDYVQSDRWSTCIPEYLPKIKPQFDLAISVWVLQHCLNAYKSIKEIKDLLKPGGELFLVNSYHRAIPLFYQNQHVWHNDGVDVREILKEEFEVRIEAQKLDKNFVEMDPKGPAYYGVYRKET